MARAGLSRSSITRVRPVLVLSLRHAERRGLVGRNVAALSDMPGVTRPAREGRALTVDQAKRLLAAVEGTRLESLWVTTLMLGLRQSEVCGLAWEDVDLEEALQVRRALKSTREGLSLGDPKTARPSPSLALAPEHRHRPAAW
jgi:integrase